MDENFEKLLKYIRTKANNMTMEQLMKASDICDKYDHKKIDKLTFDKMLGELMTELKN